MRSGGIRNTKVELQMKLNRNTNVESLQVSPPDAKPVLPAVRSFEHWTKKELESLPAREWNEDIGEFDSLIILPTKHLHDSGFWCMDFVAVKGSEPFCRLSGCSDVIHIDGIGGYRDWETDRKSTRLNSSHEIPSRMPSSA